MDVVRLFGGGIFMSGVAHDMFWPWVTVGLSLLLALGYGLIAFNWYFQSRIANQDESKATLARLRSICLCCLILAFVFYATDTPWLAWRCYDLVLLVLVVRTWLIVFHTRGVGLVQERLAQVQELERTAARYREIAELLPHMVWTATAEGCVDFSNQSWRDYVGDAGHCWLEALHPDEQQDVLTRWRHAINARQPITLEVRLLGVNAYRSFLVKATPVVRGNATKWLGTCADIEDQKLLCAEKEMQAKQRSFFFNALSHDLRAPLHNVVLNAHLLKLSTHRDQADNESLNMIVENAVAAGDLVTKLLDFAKIGALEHNAVESVFMGQILQQIHRRFLPIAQQKGLYLRIVRPGEDIKVLIDRQKLERIISNLLDNAIKYSQRGGITLEMAAPSPGEIAVRISDTGIGIPQADVPFLFEEFYQVNNHERDRSKGFGMGLAICRCLAHSIGAEVRLAGTGPDGSCFELNIKPVCSDRGGRRSSESGDRSDPQAAGICRV
jgi:signal transduction histidine kinase